jgi:hypothetical protein
LNNLCNLWISNTPNPTGGTDPYERMPEEIADPPKWVSTCFGMAQRLGANLIISGPGGHLKDSGVLHAGVFQEPEANRQFVIERERWKSNGVQLACGLYIGGLLPDNIRLDPENAHTQDFMSGPLLPFLAPGSILGVDDISPSHASAKRLYEACRCFGVRFYQEGIPYWQFPTKAAGAIPSVGTFTQHLIEDPGFKRIVPLGVDYRLRIGSDTLWPEVAKQVAICKGNGFGFDVLSWPGDPATETLVALATGRGPTT